VNHEVRRAGGGDEAAAVVDARFMLPIEWFPTELLYDVAAPTAQIVF